MTGPSSQPPPAAAGGGGLTPVGSWPVHRTPGHGSDVSGWPGYPPGTPVWLPATPPAVPARSVMPATSPPRAAPPARRSRTSEIALLLAAFVAAVGVAFAIGRWSVPQSTPVAPGLAVLPLQRGDAALVAPDAALAVPDTAGSGVTAAGAAAADTTTEGTPATSTTVGVDAGNGEPAPEAESAGGLEGGSPAMMAGMSFGGLQGAISAIEEGSLTLATESGESRSITTSAATVYLRQSTIEAADLAPGDRVRIGSLRRGPAPAGADAAGTGLDAAGEPPEAEAAGQAASQVTVIPAGSPASGRPGVTEGTLVAAVDDGIVIQTDDGDTELVLTSDGTTYAHQEPIEAKSLRTGDLVSIQLPFSGPPGRIGDGTAAATSATIAAQVTLLFDPAA